MDFSLTQEQQMLQEVVADIASEYGADYWQEIRSEHRFPAEIYDDLAEGGFFGIPFPEEYGGQDMGMLEVLLTMEALGENRAWEVPIEFVFNVVFGGISILRFGTERQREEYLPPIIEGDHRWALGVTEPDAGSNTANISTTAERDGDEFVVNGQKMWISSLHDAEYMLLLTRTTPTEELDSRYEGQTMFVVDPDDPAVEYTEIPLDVYFPDRTFQVHIDDLRLPESAVLGTVDDGLYQIFDVLNAERVATAGCAWAGGRYCLDQAVRYAKDRAVWDEPIGSHQGIQHPLAEAHAELETCRLLNRMAAWQFDADEGDLGEISNIANLEAGKAAWNAAEAAMTTLGGMSVSSEMGVAAAWGTIRHQRSTPVSEEMIRNYLGQHSLDLPRSY
jgi:acyl-CoA dehydrogenase